jgi:hypothetical protein
MYDYYDMRLGQLVELSGSDYAEERMVVETQNPITTGFCDDLFPPSVMTRIAAMRLDSAFP